MKIGIIADIHEDFEQLIKADAAVQMEKADIVVCLGDLVGATMPAAKAYYESRNAQKVLKWAEKSADICVPGNHDFSIGHFFPSYIQTPFHAWLLAPVEERMKMPFYPCENELPSIIGYDEINQLTLLPEKVRYKATHYEILFSHYLFPDFCGMYTSTMKNENVVEQHLEWMQKENIQLSFIGHEHVNELSYCSPKKKRNDKATEIDLKKMGFPLIVWVPAVQRAKSNPGITIFDTEKHMIYSKTL